ncbi:DeoR/GlpR family transcriptional regulator of sugar metabolism [Salirhabdus euzebyi]|uniref:DeoR/GlpR family transcriptional regulator of sugar metabolism n=1 Tax=Salirhabdus euzebyi TaxID=394506 RepID=A0A841Q870_9BACI|nr:DeoR/GlpR family DNA-binding transcription regulator [Salirhabdus euzebyi]MBB6454596.1 DeoR/GlpR family transcriptional regulator of sugar metabolism [Salirhabdus euzebyi]
MLPFERRKWLEQQIKIHKKIDIEEVSSQLDVSSMTIRRDLTELEKNGIVIRTHGGAISVDSVSEEIPYSSKMTKNIAEKKAISLQALQLIKENSTIILDSGTTTLELAKLLKNRNDLTIVTNDVKIANELLESSNHVIVTGGELQQGVGALYGTATQNMLSIIHADIFFLGAHAIDLDHGVTAPTFEKSLIKQLMVKASEKTWLLADFSKFNKKAFSKVCSLTEIEGLVTDSNIKPSIVDEYGTKIKIIYGEGN